MLQLERLYGNASSINQNIILFNPTVLIWELANSASSKNIKVQKIGFNKI